MMVHIGKGPESDETSGAEIFLSLPLLPKNELRKVMSVAIRELDFTDEAKEKLEDMFVDHPMGFTILLAKAIRNPEEMTDVTWRMDEQLKKVIRKQRGA